MEQNRQSDEMRESGAPIRVPVCCAEGEFYKVQHLYRYGNASLLRNDLLLGCLSYIFPSAKFVALHRLVVILFGRAPYLGLSFIRSLKFLKQLSRCIRYCFVSIR